MTINTDHFNRAINDMAYALSIQIAENLAQAETTDEIAVVGMALVHLQELINRFNLLSQKMSELAKITEIRNIAEKMSEEVPDELMLSNAKQMECIATNEIDDGKLVRTVSLDKNGQPYDPKKPYDIEKFPVFKVNSQSYIPLANLAKKRGRPKGSTVKKSKAIIKNKFKNKVTASNKIKKYKSKDK